MKLNTNFRKRELNRVRFYVATLYMTSVVLALTGFAVLFDYWEVASKAVSLEAHASELRTEKGMHENIYHELGGSLESEKNIRTEWLSLFGEYRGRRPESILYDLEKFSPQSLYLTNFTYDRHAGIGTVNAVASRNEQISSMLESLERTGDYRKVLLVSKSEMEKTGNFKIAVRLEERNGRDVNE